MNNSGFTLVELTAIIVILALIFLVTFPNLQNTARSDKEKQYETMKENLCLAGKTYIYSNMSNFGELTQDKKIEILVSDLIKNDIVEETINPKSKKSIKNSILNYIVLEDGTLECDYNE